MTNYWTCLPDGSLKSSRSRAREHENWIPWYASAWTMVCQCLDQEDTSDTCAKQSFPLFRFADYLGLAKLFDFQEVDMPSIRIKVLHRLLTNKI